jgi:hypothetical protein
MLLLSIMLILSIAVYFSLVLKLTTSYWATVNEVVF